MCNGILNNRASQSRLKEARQVHSNQRQELAANKKRKFEVQCSNSIAKAGGLASLQGGSHYGGGKKKGGSSGIQLGSWIW